MNCPPVKAWTSIYPKNGARHFVAINYEFSGKSSFVYLVSVLDRDIFLKIEFKELEDSSKWLSGWHDLSTNDSPSKKLQTITSELNETKDSNKFFQVSEDAGLAIPLIKKKYRPWF